MAAPFQLVHRAKPCGNRGRSGRGQKAVANYHYPASRSVGELQENIGVAGILGTAPAGQVPSGQLATNVFHRKGQPAAPQSLPVAVNAPGPVAIDADAKGVAPAGRGGHYHSRMRL